MFIAFIMILFWIVLSKFNSLSSEKKELQEEPIAPIAPIDRLINITLLYKGEGSLSNELYLGALR